MKFKSNLSDSCTGSCPHQNVVWSQTGGFHFDGEPWDNIHDVYFCIDCGCSVIPVDEHEDSEPIPF